MTCSKKHNLSFENEMLELNGRKLIFKSINREILLSKRQLGLIVCLLNEINEKKAIIRYVWSEDNPENRENNYNQLVYQLRALFIRHDLPSDLLITLPRYGLCLNKEWLGISNRHRQHMSCIVNDHAAYL
jgi:DNA-binding winged helix-turn-helix (wHTH) protein